MYTRYYFISMQEDTYLYAGRHFLVCRKSGKSQEIQNGDRLPVDCCLIYLLFVFVYFLQDHDSYHNLLSVPEAGQSSFAYLFQTERDARDQISLV